MIDSGLEAAVGNLAPIGAAFEIEGVADPLIFRYFETLNAEDYDAAASLFGAEGVMHPPFEGALVGQDAIADYLKTEAKGMRLQPRQGVQEAQDNGWATVQVTGKVQTPLFGVNVNWQFVLSAAQIQSVRIKLIASPQELLKLRR